MERVQPSFERQAVTSKKTIRQGDDLVRHVQERHSFQRLQSSSSGFRVTSGRLIQNEL